MTAPLDQALTVGGGIGAAQTCADCAVQLGLDPSLAPLLGGLLAFCLTGAIELLKRRRPSPPPTETP